MTQTKHGKQGVTAYLDYNIIWLDNIEMPIWLLKAKLMIEQKIISYYYLLLRFVLHHSW